MSVQIKTGFKVMDKKQTAFVKNGHCSLMVGAVASEEVFLLYVSDVLHVF